APAPTAPTPTLRRKSRRPTVALFSFFIASLPDQSSWSVRERKCFSFDFQKHAAKRAHRSVELGARRTLHVGEHAGHPGCYMLFKKGALYFRRGREAAGGKARHYLA